MAYGNTVTIIGRLKDTMLNCKFDGRDYPIAFGENYGFPAEAVDFALAQNLIRGTRHPYNPQQFDSYVGIKGAHPSELGHDCSVIEKRVTECDEDLDRSQLAGAEERKAKRGPRRSPSQFEARVGMDLGNDAMTRNVG